MTLLKKAGERIGILGIKLIVLVCAWIISTSSFVACESYRYESRGKRDPFVPLIGTDKPSVVRLEDVTSIEEIILEGIASEAKGRRAAMINGRILKKDDKVGDVEIKKIGERTVTLLISGKRCDIELSEKGGQKGGRSR